MTVKRNVTIIDIAREAGVSAATVSNAINNRRYVEPQTKLRIDEAAARLGYFPNLHARRLRTGQVGAIALFSSMPFAVSGRDSRLGFFMEIAATAAMSASESGIALVLVPPMATAHPPLDYLAIDGALVVEPMMDDPFIMKLAQRAIPVVTIGKRPDAGRSHAYVDLRSGETARLLLDELFSASARRVALIVGSARRTSYIQAEEVYLEMAAKRRMKPVIRRIEESGGQEAGYQATLELLRENPELDGMFVAVDAFAAGAVRALNELRISIPSGLRLVTRYDGLLSRQSTPPITAVDIHLPEIATLAVDLLMRLLRGESSKMAIVGPMPTLIRRRSTEQVAPAKQRASR